MDSDVRPEFDVLVAEHRRMAERRERRAQPAPTVTAPPAPVAKATPTAAVAKAPWAEELLRKAAALKAPPEAAAISDADRRAQLRAQHAEVMQQAMRECGAGRLSVLEVAQLQATRLRADAALDGHVDAVEELQALRLRLDETRGG